MKKKDVVTLAGLLSILASDKSQSYITKKDALRLRRMLYNELSKQNKLKRIA